MLKHLTILLILGSWATLFAQEPLRYTTKQGLPTNHIYDIAEDENGFMWFATKQGLVKYDGETFKTFTIQDGLPNNDTWLLELDSKARLWFFTKSAYQGYIKNDSIHTISRKDKKVLSPRFLYKSKDDLRFHSTLGTHLLTEKEIIADDYYNIDSYERINKEFANIQKSNGFKGDYLMPIIYNPKSNDYIFLQEKKALIFDKNFKLKKELPIHISLEYDINKRNIDNQGLLYNSIGYYATDKGVLFINFTTYKTFYIIFKELVGVENTKYFRLFGTENNIQISIPGNLIILDYQFAVLATYNLPKHLSRKSFKDSKGNIWMTDLANGISLMPNTQISTQYFLKNLKIQKINFIENNLFAGVNEKGFFQFNKNNNDWTQLSDFKRGHGEIYQIKEDAVSKANYFIVANSGYQWSQSQLSPLSYEDNPITSGRSAGTKDISSFQNHNFIVTGSYFLKSDTSFKSVEVLAFKSGLLFTEVFNQQLYVAGSDGLFQVENDQLIKPKQKNELFDVPISTLSTSAEFLLVGTDGRGVYLYTEKGVFHLKETDGLSVQRILKKDNVLWLATQRGVKKVALNTENLSESKLIDAYFDADGLLQNNINDIYLENNKLYAASDIGLSVLNIENPIYKERPIIYFKTKNDTLHFKNAERDNISISFAVQDYRNQDYITFEYRLLPTQTQWQKTTTKILNFSNLSPKLFQLEVKVTNQHNLTSTKTLYLNLIPKWWQTDFAKIGFALFALFLFYLIFLLTKKQIRKKEQARAQQEKRIAGLELQALRSQMNPHFVHNSLNAIQYFIQRNEVELSENYLSKFSQLIRLFFEYSRRQTVTIQEELDLLKNYLEIEKLRFEEKLSYTLNVCEKFDTEDQLIPSMLLQPIVENAVNHGIFHKKENGNITITFKYIDENSYKVTVEDDGIGIHKSKTLFKASSKNYQSNSSKVLYERLELLNQSGEWNISFDITDKSDINLLNTGTTVTLIFNQLSN